MISASLDVPSHGKLASPFFARRYIASAPELLLESPMMRFMGLAD
jgi:hypothetical protein